MKKKQKAPAGNGSKAIPAPAKHPQLHVIALGGAGCNMLEHFCSKGLQAKYTCINNTPRFLQGTIISFVSFNAPVAAGSAAGLSADGNSPVQALPHKIKRRFKQGEHYLLLAGIGGYTGSVMLQQITSLLNRRKLPYTAICCLPFAFESPGRQFFKTQTIDLLKNDPNIRYYNLESTRGKYPGLTLNKVFEQVHETIYTMFWETEFAQSINNAVAH